MKLAAPRITRPSLDSKAAALLAALVLPSCHAVREGERDTGKHPGAPSDVPAVRSDTPKDSRGLKVVSETEVTRLGDELVQVSQKGDGRSAKVQQAFMRFCAASLARFEEPKLPKGMGLDGNQLADGLCAIIFDEDRQDFDVSVLSKAVDELSAGTVSLRRSTEAELESFKVRSRGLCSDYLILTSKENGKTQRVIFSESPTPFQFDQD